MPEIPTPEAEAGGKEFKVALGSQVNYDKPGLQEALSQ